MKAGGNDLKEGLNEEAPPTDSEPQHVSDAPELLVDTNNRRVKRTICLIKACEILACLNAVTSISAFIAAFFVWCFARRFRIKWMWLYVLYCFCSVTMNIVVGIIFPINWLFAILVYQCFFSFVCLFVVPYFMWWTTKLTDDEKLETMYVMGTRNRPEETDVPPVEGCQLPEDPPKSPEP